MGFKRLLSLLLLSAGLIALLIQPAWASGSDAGASAAANAAASSEQTDSDGASEAASPVISKAAGAFGLIFLLALGAITSGKRARQEELGYDIYPDGSPIGDPYSRLAGEDRKKRRRFF